MTTPPEAVSDASLRVDGRRADDLRPVTLELGYLQWAEGSVLFEMGRTRVLAAASYDPRVPKFKSGTGTGWVSAEYAMLPRATETRTPREIQRLIGRSLRAVTDLKAMGECTIWIDCDVLQADGGTRTASITAGYIALAAAVRSLLEQGLLPRNPLREEVAAVSAGIVDGTALLDLAYSEDSRAEVDFNVVMTGSGALVEVQGTAEGEPFSRAELDSMMDLAWGGIRRLVEVQRAALAG